MTDQNLLTNLHKACSILSGRDMDYARQDNKIGWSGWDSEMGHVLSDKPISQWSPKMTGIAVKKLQKYRKQLATSGFDTSLIPTVEEFSGTVVTHEKTEDRQVTTKWFKANVKDVNHGLSQYGYRVGMNVFVKKVGDGYISLEHKHGQAPRALTQVEAMNSFLAARMNGEIVYVTDAESTALDNRYSYLINR